MTREKYRVDILCNTNIIDIFFFKMLVSDAF